MKGKEKVNKNWYSNRLQQFCLQTRRVLLPWEAVKYIHIFTDLTVPVPSGAFQDAIFFFISMTDADF
jgi:hypothetical protein